MQIKLFLVCQKCLKNRNYCTTKTKKPQSEKLILKKYCSYCRQTQNHKEEIIKKSKTKR